MAGGEEEEIASLRHWCVFPRRRRRDDSRDARCADYRRRIELLQDYEFPVRVAVDSCDQCGATNALNGSRTLPQTASSRIKLSPDSRYAVACGVYQPQMRCYELDQLCMKFDRHMDAEVRCTPRC